MKRDSNTGTLPAWAEYVDSIHLVNLFQCDVGLVDPENAFIFQSFPKLLDSKKALAFTIRPKPKLGIVMEEHFNLLGLMFCCLTSAVILLGGLKAV